MFRRNYPIMFGLGTKIVTSYHHPSFKTGLMVAICDSKKTFKEKGVPISDNDFKEAYNGILKELYFDKPDTLRKFIAQLQTSLDEWEKSE